MQSIGKAYRRKGNAGVPLPTTYRSLEAAKVRFRRSATSMIAGRPGHHKSIFALNLLALWSAQGIPGLYFSADSDEGTVGERLAAIRSGHPIETVAHQLGEGSAYYQSFLDELSAPRFYFDMCDIEQIDACMNAFEAVHGAFPPVVFVDNLLNVSSDVEGDGGWGPMMSLTKDLEKMARASGSHICVLHHTSTLKGEPNLPPPLWAIQGQVSQIPRLILTVAKAGEMFNVAPVKNSHGPDEASGEWMLPFRVDQSNLRITEGMQFMQPRLEVVR